MAELLFPFTWLPIVVKGALNRLTVLYVCAVTLYMAIHSNNRIRIKHWPLITRPCYFDNTIARDILYSDNTITVWFSGFYCQFIQGH